MARDLARVNLDVFLGEDFDAIVTNAAGCGSTLKEYDHLFPADAPEHKRALRFAPKCATSPNFWTNLVW